MSVVHQVYGHFMRQLTSWVRGAAQKVGEQAKLLGAKKVLIVTDAFLNQIGMAKEIAGIIEEAGIKNGCFTYLTRYDAGEILFSNNVPGIG